jgi:hypothetical protein
MSTNPWDKDFTPAAIDENVIKDIQSALAPAEQAVEQIVPAVENVTSGTVQTTESAITNAVSGALPGAVAGTITKTQIPDITGTLESVIEAAAKGSAKSALQSLAPSLEAELAKEFQATVEKVVNRATGGTDVAPTPNLEDFTHADARSRALRTLLLGLAVAVLAGLGTVAGQFLGLDLSTHNGQVAAVSITISAVLSSVGAYVGRLVKEPPPIAPLSAQLPTKASQ